MVEIIKNVDHQRSKRTLKDPLRIRKQLTKLQSELENWKKQRERQPEDKIPGRSRLRQEVKLSKTVILQAYVASGGPGTIPEELEDLDDAVDCLSSLVWCELFLKDEKLQEMDLKQFEYKTLRALMLRLLDMIQPLLHAVK